jgi:hypothetical protein
VTKASLRKFLTHERVEGITGVLIRSGSRVADVYSVFLDTDLGLLVVETQGEWLSIDPKVVVGFALSLRPGADDAR